MGVASLSPGCDRSGVGTISIGKSIRGMSCIEVVRFSEGPLLEVFVLFMT